MKIEDFEKLHYGQEIYWKGKKHFISKIKKETFGEKCIGFKTKGSCFIFKRIMHELSFDKPKAKVLRAQYLYKVKGGKRPRFAFEYYINQKDFLDSMGTCKEGFGFITRLQETEREFDE